MASEWTAALSPALSAPGLGARLCFFLGELVCGGFYRTRATVTVTSKSQEVAEDVEYSTGMDGTEETTITTM